VSDQMNILSFDTSTHSCSVALMMDGKLVSESTSVAKGTHAMRLMPMIDTLLRRSDLPLSAIDGFAATVGPGSFTGLRIGISTLKGLAAATRKPVVGISSLQALAHQCSLETELVSPMMDARKGEVYYCRYRRCRQGLTPLADERNAAPVDAVGGIDLPCAFVGDGAVAYRDMILSALGKLAVIAPEHEHVIRAETVAEFSKDCSLD